MYKYTSGDNRNRVRGKAGLTLFTGVLLLLGLLVSSIVSAETNEPAVFNITLDGVSEEISVPEGKQIVFQADIETANKFTFARLSKIEGYQCEIIGQLTHFNSREDKSDGVVWEIDTLGWEPSDYTLCAAYRDNESALTAYVSIEITVTPNNASTPIIEDAIRASDDFLAIYDDKGTLIEAGSSLSPSQVLKVAIDFSKINSVENLIAVDFLNPDGTATLKRNWLDIVVERGSNQASLNTTIAADGDEVRIIPVRLPEHLPYYEYDGVLEFKFRYTSSDGIEQNESLRFAYDDLPALSEIPENTDVPVDSFEIDIIRFGDRLLASDQELDAFAREIEREFKEATKGYFEIQVVNIQSESIFDDLERTNKIKNWYRPLPTTPGEQKLDIDNNLDALYLAALQYYSEHESELTAYASELIRSDQSRPTVVIADTFPDLGRAAGKLGAYIKGNRFYPTTAFKNTSANTYHFIPDIFSGRPATDAGDFIDKIIIGNRNQTITAKASTLIHEFGHFLWSEPVGITTGDLQDLPKPFNRGFNYIDRSSGYFTRNEYMSYGRNRTSLENMTYGDALLERILNAYASLNTDPVVTSSNTTVVSENSTAVLDIIATDEDGDALSFAITGGEDQSLFTINATGQLSFLTGQNTDNPADASRDNIYEVEVTVDDGNGGSATQAIAITVSKLQQVSLDCADRIGAGKTFKCTVNYTTSDQNPASVGLGFKLHYDSSKLQFNGFSNTLGTNLLGQNTQPQDDVNDLDGDSSTDKFLNTAWAAAAGDWPGGDLPTPLYEVEFTLNENLSVDDTATFKLSSETSSDSIYSFQAAPTSITAAPDFSWDVDGDNDTSFITDGIMVIRYLFGFRGDELVNGVLGESASRDAAAIAQYLSDNIALLDIDGDGNSLALSDGLLLIRYLAGFKGDTLINSAINPAGSRNTAEAVENYMQVFRE